MVAYRFIAAAGADCDGLTIEVLVELVRGGLATAQTERVVGLNMVPSCTTVGRFCWRTPV